MKLMRIDDVLKDLYVSNTNLNQMGVQLTERMVYNYLKKLGLSQQERNVRIDGYFNDFIETFRDTPNIMVFRESDRRNFCQFINGEVNPKCIKMYVSLDSSHVIEGTKMIFDFLARNNISHKSKIGSEIRTDEIVIRVGNVEDAQKVSSFISDNKYIQEGMQMVNPFCFEENGIGYAYDGHLSYNACVAKLISEYIKRMYALDSDKNEINGDSFYSFVSECSKNPEFLNNLPYVDGDSESIFEASLIIDLVKSSLGSNNINDFFNFYKNIVNQNKEDLFKEVILTTMQKYPRGYDVRDPKKSGYSFLEVFLRGNVNGITRMNNLRERVRYNLSPDDAFTIASQNLDSGEANIETVLTYIRMVMLNEIIRSSQIRFSDGGLDQIQDYLNSGNLKYITQSVGSARTIAKSLSPDEIRDLLLQLGVQDIYEYAKYYYGNNNISTKHR